MALPTLLRLEYDVAAVPDGGSQVYCHLAGLVKSHTKDAAGHAYHEKSLIQAGLYAHAVAGDSDGDVEDEQEDGSIDDGHTGADKAAEGVQWKSKGKKKREEGSKGSSKGEKKKDLYALLGLKDVRWMATESQLKKAYQKQALKHHPDKACAGVEDERERTRLEEKFKSILDAYETLMDPVKRREYDSVDDFDDSLPDSCQAKDFYTVFGAAFKRQSRWSEKKPVPDLGDESTPYEDVQRFYDFWYGFKSWREFPHPDEEDPESAECREHRRWIDRENARLRNRAKKEETRRLRDFVEAAYRSDPRVVAYKQAQKEAREQRKREKYEAANREKLAEEARKAEEERIQAEKALADKAAADAAKKNKQQEQRELRKQRKRLRDICSVEEHGEELYEAADVEEMCAAFTRVQLSQLCDKVETESCEDAKRSLLNDALNLVYLAKGEEELNRKKAAQAAAKEARASRKAALSAQLQQMGEWSEEECRMLDKALQKFPIGTARRWEQVASYVRTRTQDEILLMVKVKQGASASQTASDWRAGRKGGTAANVTIQSAPDQRENAFTDVTVKDGSDENQAPQPSENGAAPPKAVTAESGTWTQEQELALVQAMKTISKDEDDRWTKVAKLVAGKSAAECLLRFKELKASFKKK